MTDVYVSGKISSLTEEEYTANFAAGCSALKALNYNPVNPLKVNPCHGEDCNSNGPRKLDGTYLHAWTCYMRYDIIAMLKCDAIMMLPDWTDSKGAQLEKLVAEKCGLAVFYFDGEKVIV